MSIKECIDNARDAGEVTAEEAEQLKKRWDKLSKQVFARGAARDALLNEIKAEATERRRRTQLTQEARQRIESFMNSYVNSRGYHDPAEAMMLVLESVGASAHPDVVSRQKTLIAAAQSQLQELLDEMSGSIKLTGDLGRRFGKRKARLDNIVRELFGEKTGDARAQVFAQAWMQVAEDLRQKFNAAGGAIQKLDKWGLPQHHNREVILKTGRERWVEQTFPLLDRQRMVHPVTGRAYDDDELRDTLRYIWREIVTDGWATREPTGQPQGRGALFSQHADHRFLHFKSADAWLKYQRDLGFGDRDAFATMMGHISRMARDIAFMQIMGPNPTTTLEYMTQVARSYAANTKPNRVLREEQLGRIRALFPNTPALAKAHSDLAGVVTELDRLNREADRARYSDITLTQATAPAGNALEKIEQQIAKQIDLYDQTVDRMVAEAANDPTFRLDSDRLDERTRLLGDLKRALPEHMDDPDTRVHQFTTTTRNMFDIMRGAANIPYSERVANFMQGLRNLITGASLGGAGVSAISDVSFQRAARKLAGMPTSHITAEYVRQLSSGGQQAAVKAGVILESALHVMDRQARVSAAANFSGYTGYIAERVLVAGGLLPITQAGKQAWGMDFQAHMADTLATPFARLNRDWKKFLMDNGFTQADWETLQSVPIHDERGVKFLLPRDVLEADEQVGYKYLGALYRFMSLAVPEPGVRARAALYGGAAPGSIPGEVLRIVAQFKGFSIGILFTWGSQVFRQSTATGIGAGAAVAVPLLIHMTLLGGVALQIKELVKGNDARPMDDNFWGAAFLQGGGLGIYGDFIFADVNRFGGGLESTMSGPVVGRIDNLRNLTIGNLMEAWASEDTNFGRELVRFLRQNTPGGNVPYVRMIYERMLLDNLQKLLDPEADKAFRRQIQNKRRDYGQEFWWAPGQTLPQRAPRIDSAVEFDKVSSVSRETNVAEAPPEPAAQPAQVAQATQPVNNDRETAPRVTKREPGTIPTVA